MDEVVKQFMKKFDLSYIVGFSGGSDDNKELVQKVIEESIMYFKNQPLAVLTGGTTFGVPKYASEIAKDNGMKTIGVLPERGEKYALKSLDLKLVAEPRYSTSEFGDESEVFAKLLNGVEIIGGSAGTAIEFYHIMKINDRKLNPKYSETPVYIAPIEGVGGFSSQINSTAIFKKLPEVFPSDKLYYGGDAAKFILNKLGLY